ncbi:MAG: HK97 family phage prohead protease [Desulfobacterales bacterium]|nr:HK97 family phage prohead protease [Desulfobacterales bacterium]
MTKVLAGLTDKKDLVTERLKLKDLYPERAEALAKEHKIDIEDLELVRKGIVAEKAEVDKDERAVTSYINTGKQDRDNEKIEPEGAVLTYYRKNPVVPYAHDYRGLPVGKNIWIKKDKKGLIAKTVFAKHQFADEVYRLYSEDIAGTGPVMRAWSIGFIPLKWEESPEGKGKPPKEGEMDTRPKRTYKKWELLEYSPVMIPSNREALTEMVEKGLITSDKLKKDIAEFIEIEDGTPYLYTNEAGTLVTQEEILEEWIEKEVVTKIEETEEYIRIPAKGESGKHKKHKIRWITVSEKQGIRGIYCIDCKKIITYVFMKNKGWTLEKAKKWMEEHGKLMQDVVNHWNEIMPDEKDNEKWEFLEELLELASEGKYNPNPKAKYDCECIKCGHKLTSDKHCKELKCPKCGGQMRRVERPGPGQESLDREVIELEENETKGVIPFRETAKAPEGEKWDGPREIREAEVSDLKIMCCWFDSEKPDIKGSYKLPHHKAKGHAVVWRAVAQCMAILFGARGGVDVPSGDRKGIYNHLVKEYKRFDKEPPEFREYTEEELKGEFPEIYYEHYYQEADREHENFIKDIYPQLLDKLEDMQQEITSLKEGRVLSEKNRKLVKQCADMLNELYNATEPPKREEFELEIEEGKDKPEKLEIDKEALTLKIASIIKSKIGEMVQSAIDRARGKVE